MSPDTLFAGVRLLDPAAGLDEPGELLVPRRPHRRSRRRPRPPGRRRRGRWRRRPCSAPAWSTCAPRSASRASNTAKPSPRPREAAAAGGITTLAALPDTLPAIDDPALVRLLRARGEETGSLTILPYGAVTRGCRGEELAELGLLREAGAVAFTDGARAIGSARMMRLALSYARGFGALDRAAPGGAVARRRRRRDRRRARDPARPARASPPRPRRSWWRATFGWRALTGGAVHFAHVSTAGGPGADPAREGGWPRASPATPRRPIFDLNETAIGDFSHLRQVCPRRCARKPTAWRSLAALADGTIDAIASDHQPRDADDKRLPFAQAAPGGAGLATLLARHACPGPWRRHRRSPRATGSADGPAGRPCSASRPGG